RAADFFAAGLRAAVVPVARLRAAAFLAGAFFATAALRPGGSAACASDAVVRAPAFAPALALPSAALALLLSNSKLIRPSGWRTRNALNLRRVRDETNPVSRSVRPSARSLRI